MKKTKNTYDFIISLLLTFIAVLFMGYIGDYFFDLNDDVLMKDMLSGAYTGAPEAHNIQMLYPISAFISMFYRVVIMTLTIYILTIPITFSMFILALEIYIM